MARGVSHKCFPLLLLLVLTTCSSGTLVGFSYLASRELEFSSFLKLRKGSLAQIRLFVPADHGDVSVLSRSGVSADLQLSESLVENLISSNLSAISWLSSHIQTLQQHINVTGVVVSCMSDGHHGQNEMLKLFSALKSVHSIIQSFPFHEELKVSVAFSSSSLEQLGRTKYEKDLQRVFCFVKKTRSFVIVQASTDDELAMIKRFNFAASDVRCYDVPMILAIKNPSVPIQADLYADLSSLEEKIFPASRRELLMSFKTTSHDAIDPPTTPIYNPTPGIITVPSTNPVTMTPAIPASTPVPIPSTTPVTVPSTNPNNPTVPITNPVTTPVTPVTVPVTNPVTTYPAPTGGVPVTTPVTNPLPPPTVVNAPAIPGQSWCVARTGAPETSLQLGLDYACGNGADCSQIQQGGSCYNPNTVQNHASYAFNSYYQKNPVATSCDFGGTGAVINTNPSTGSCIFSSLASPSTPTTAPVTTTPAPATTTPAPAITTPATSTSSGTGGASSITPPAVLNSSNPAPATATSGSDVPPNFNSASIASALQPFMGLISWVSSIVIVAVIQSI